ncbi:response regulator [Bdellovibrio sp. ZAP7]|uniref:response regulator n=1 Tax=Bdellovibrio sp. ZAP7 TaxID=2231053 RepID=UPI00143D43F2|nr:response regulator [Bdellovibrio sp. ZAP7]
MKTVDVLIVDDRMDGLLALQAVLSMPQVNLVKAQSGPEALSLLDGYEFAVILLDVQMPGMDGFETARQIRQDSKNRQTPIIFVTAINKDDQYIYRGYEAGAVDYIFKPFEPSIVRAKVNVFVELFIKSKQLEEQAELIRESETRERYLRLAELEVENLRRYRSLADAIPHIIWRAKADGTFDYFNKGWTDYTGLTIEQSLGSGWQSVAVEEDLREFLKTWMMAMSDGRSFETECRMVNKEGEARWFWVRAVSETNFLGQVVAWIGTCTDIHDRKKIELKLIEAEQKANAASVSKTNFLANMSHEIRTPMNAILGFTELMLDEEQTAEERHKWIHTVQRNGDQLLKIIDEILDISKVESGRLQIEKVDVDVEGVLEDIRSLLRLQALDKALDFRIDLDTHIPKIITSDPTRLRQILLNLIGNAIKFTSAGHVHVDVEWKPRGSLDLHSKMQFYISDSGVGINPAHANHLFQPFVQEDSATTRNFGGTGLGLALSRQLARAMGGDVTLVSSVPGQGSTFLVEVNADPVDGTIFVESLSSEVPQNDKEALYKERKKLSGMKILLVEDVEDNQALIAHFLGAVGASVDFADNGREGVESALKNEYDAVLMDIQMPIMDGYEATRRLRAQGYDKPIIALTAHALKEETVKSMNAGCTCHLSKPVNFNQLIEVLANIHRDRGHREDHCAI